MLQIPQNSFFQIQSQPLQKTVPSAWLQNQEYEQLLDFLGQQFNEHHERDNQIADIFDENKIPENLLRLMAYNLGIEIPVSEELESFARRAILKAIPVYKGKGTFDALNSDSHGLGLWIKALTGYDIDVTTLDIINPMMFVNQINYRCALEREDAYEGWEAIHPYEFINNVNRIMYLDELPKYVCEPENVLNGFGFGYNTGTKFSIAIYDYAQDSLVNTQDIPNIDADGITFSYDNRFYTLFGSLSGAFVNQIAIYDFPKNSMDIETGITLPAGTTEIELAELNELRSYRNFCYFSGYANGTTAVKYLYRYNVLTKTVEEVSVLGADPACFSDTKCYYEDSGFLKGYDLIKEEDFTLGSIVVYTGTVNSIAFYKDKIFAYGDNDTILVYDIFLDYFYTVNAVIDDTTTSFTSAGKLTIFGGRIALEKEDTVNGKSKCFSIPIDTFFLSSNGEDVNFTTFSDFLLLGKVFSIFGAYITSGRVTYPSTLIINIDSSGEFTSDKLLYARKMQIIKDYILRYVQSGILPIINDDNPL